MALTKVLTGGLAADSVDNTILKLDDNYALTGIVTGTVAGTDAFSARGNADSWIAASINDIVQFPDDSTGDSFDTGSRYSTSTYKYTARADGVYLFYYVLYVANTDSTNGFGFLKNSTKIAMQYNATNNFSFDQGTDDLIQNASIILPLSANDTMAVMASIASDYYRGHSHWGGCRLA
tara:strand:- start:195 stop:728 length:534 start_codon:yes stop_codon:yes gene_type:complete